MLPHGHHIAKAPVSEPESRAGAAGGALILVTAMSPTPSGEGKTTTSIGLGDALKKAGHKMGRLQHRGVDVDRGWEGVCSQVNSVTAR